MAYFPAFIELKDRKCLVFGGGELAYRKIQILLEFGADVTVMYFKLSEEIQKMENVKKLEKMFEVQDLDEFELVVAATEDARMNVIVAEECRKKKILVNAVDVASCSDFIFPSYIKKGDVVAAFSSGGKSPVVTQYLKEQNQEIVTEELAELTDILRELRRNQEVCALPMKLRKVFYQEVLALGLAKGQVPDEEEITDIFAKYKIEA